MSCITIAKEIKSIHPEDVALIKLGGFYKVYGKDAYILAKLLGYKIKEEEKIEEEKIKIYEVLIIYTIFLIKQRPITEQIQEKSNFFE